MCDRQPSKPRWPTTAWNRPQPTLRLAPALFGGPSIATTDRDGTETWVYERSATQTDVQANSQAAQGTASLGAFFKYVDLQAGGSMARSSAASSTSSSISSLTVIVKFAPDKTVADYSVRASRF